MRRTAIDVARWDAAVLRDATPLPYGLHWWLDAATNHRWDGLVLDDYRVVLPLPTMKRFWMLPAAIRPPYTQQLGPYGDVVPGDAADLLQAVPRTFQTALTFAPTLNPAEIPPRYHYRRRINYVVDLSPPFSVVRKRFPRTLQAYLRKSINDTLEVMPTDPFVALCLERLGDRKGIKARHFEYLRQIIDAAVAQELGACYQLREEGELLAAGFFPTLHHRTINIAPVSTARGLKRRGMSRLLALIMERESGVPGAVFDFEGSELPGVREYFAKFGGQDEGYYLLENMLFGLMR
ncbi:hypothetical protein [Neolewinella sp.]|uniref:hypothetical protein n=1 Tax=Neolewinella sp. TaxID=2993543 RepID=UPI003B5288CC